MTRLGLCVLTTLASLPAFAGEPDLSSPSATVRSYLAATKANDVETAKKCWSIDENASGTLDVVVGMWIETRKLIAVTESKFGAEGLKLLGRWNRPSCTDRAIDRTSQRVASATLREGESAARLVVTWAPEDRETDPAFLCGAPFRLRRAGDQWKLDANIVAGEPSTVKLWTIWRDEMAVMQDLTTGLEKGQYKELGEFERDLRSRVAALKAKYERKN